MSMRFGETSQDAPVRHRSTTSVLAQAREFPSSMRRPSLFVSLSGRLLDRKRALSQTHKGKLNKRNFID